MDKKQLLHVIHGFTMVSERKKISECHLDKVTGKDSNVKVKMQLEMFI